MSAFTLSKLISGSENVGGADEIVYKSPIVLTFIPLALTITAPTITAIRDGGILLSFFGHKIRIAREIIPIRNAMGLNVEVDLTSSAIFSVVSTGDPSKVIPQKSLICPTTIVTAIPNVKPRVIVLGMYLIRLPKRQNPIITRKIPAKIVDITSPSMPSVATIPATIVANAAVGPAICTRLPPRNDTTKPATMAV